MGGQYSVGANRMREFFRSLGTAAQTGFAKPAMLSYEAQDLSRRRSSGSIRLARMTTTKTSPTSDGDA